MVILSEHKTAQVASVAMKLDKATHMLICNSNSLTFAVFTQNGVLVFDPYCMGLALSKQSGEKFSAH